MTLYPFHGTSQYLCPLEMIRKLGFLMYFREYQIFQKETSAMKWFKDIFNKYASSMLISMTVSQQNILSYSPSALVFQCTQELIKVDYKAGLEIHCPNH